MGAEFTKMIKCKGLMNKTAEYLPRLLTWVNEKIIFWQSVLGCATCTLIPGNKVGTRQSFSITAGVEKKGCQQ